MNVGYRFSGCSLKDIFDSAFSTLEVANILDMSSVADALDEIKLAKASEQYL